MEALEELDDHWADNVWVPPMELLPLARGCTRTLSRGPSDEVAARGAKLVCVDAGGAATSKTYALV